MEDRTNGLVWWYEKTQGLNGYGLIPGTNLLDCHVSKQEFNAFWGSKNYNNGARYKTMVSPKMVWRIRNHFQKVFQRPIGAKDEFPYQFGRGLLAVKKGWPINWAAYARKMAERGTGDRQHLGPRRDERPRKATKRKINLRKFLTMEELRARVPAKKWPKNEVFPSPGDLEGRKDDWDTRRNLVINDLVNDSK